MYRLFVDVHGKKYGGRGFVRCVEGVNGVVVKLELHIGKAKTSVNCFCCCFFVTEKPTNQVNHQVETTG